MSVIDWLYANKEWLLSGVGIAIPIAIISWFLMRKSNSQKQIQKSGNNSINIQVGRDLDIGNIKSKDKNGEK
jgi:plastocyanin domain-containing protein